MIPVPVALVLCVFFTTALAGTFRGLGNNAGPW